MIFSTWARQHERYLSEALTFPAQQLHLKGITRPHPWAPPRGERDHWRYSTSAEFAGQALPLP
jgi:hypothetical protein